jgi:hypothetical protein
MLHHERPPCLTLQRLLTETSVSSSDYGHLLLEQSVTPIDDAIVAGLRPYFESAHLDAREVFHKAARISLHPEDGARGSHATYPTCLPPKTTRGLFGEVMAGMIAQAYPLIGSKRWEVPIFLFRYHGPVGAYIFNLVRDPSRTREVHGRPGNDFIGLELSPNFTVAGFIAGEAKWRSDLTASAMDTIMKGDGRGKGAARVFQNNGVWNDINNALAVPEGLQQLCDLLAEKDKAAFQNTIVSLDEALLGVGTPPPRTDLVFIAGNRSPSRAKSTALLPTAAAPPECTSNRPLQVVEIVLEDGEGLIDRIYNSLWKANG